VSAASASWLGAPPLTTLLAAAEVRNEGWIGNWSPGIGDPSLVGWLTVVAYLLAAGLCWRAFRRLGPRDGADRVTANATAVVLLFLTFTSRRARILAAPAVARLRALWLGLATVLLLLGINKQLDIQTAFTEALRGLAIDQGWYDIRRPIQVAFILLVAVIGLLTFRAVMLLARGELRGLSMVLGGVVFIICFVIIRAASFHHIDRLLGSDIGGFRLNWIIELGGILFIAVGAYRYTRPSSAR
jgi:hypothetical protein